MIYLLSDAIVQVVLLFTRYLYSYGLLPHQVQISLLTRKHRSSSNRFVNMCVRYCIFICRYVCVYTYVCVCVRVCTCVCVLHVYACIMTLLNVVRRYNCWSYILYNQEKHCTRFEICRAIPIKHVLPYSSPADHLWIRLFTSQGLEPLPVILLSYLHFVGRFLPEYWLHFGVCCNRYRNISVNRWRGNIWSWKGIVNKKGLLHRCFNLVAGF